MKNKESFEFQLRRHPEKKGQEVVSPEGEKNPLPLEGIIQAQAEGVKLADQIKETPPNTVFLGYTSNQPRTKEADFIFGQELSVVSKNLPDSKVFDMAKEESLENISKEVNDNIDKVIIINSLEDKILGIRDKWNMKELEDKISELGELGFLKEWSDSIETQELVGLSPQDIKEEFQAWIKEQMEEIRKFFPDRPVIISGIGHSVELDTAIVALMGKDLTSKNFEEMGGVINTMEGAKIIIDGSGNGTIEYRGKIAKLDLE